MSHHKFNSKLNAAVETSPTLIPPKTDLKTAFSKSVKGKSFMKCKATGVGSCAGKVNMPNRVFESLVDTNDAWITKRTGIQNRHILEPGMRIREIAAESAKSALANAGVKASEIDLVILVLQTIFLVTLLPSHMRLVPQMLQLLILLLLVLVSFMVLSQDLNF